MSSKLTKTPANVGVRALSELALDLRSKLLDIAGPITWPHNKSSWLASVAHRIGITPRTARAILAVEQPYPHSRTVEAIRAAWAKHQQQGEADARDRAAAITRQIESLQAELAALTSHMQGQSAPALGREVGGQSGREGKAREENCAVD